MAEAKEKEAKMAARRAEIEAAKKRELELQRQLEAMNDDDSSSDDEGPEQITPQESTPTLGGSQISHHEHERKPSPPPAIPATSPPPPAVVTTPPAETESKNPYFKMMSQASEASSPAVSTDAAPVTRPPAPAADPSTNPFHRMTQENKAPPAPTGPI